MRKRKDVNPSPQEIDRHASDNLIGLDRHRKDREDSAVRNPEAIPAPKPSARSPVACEVAKPKKAPINMIPSTPILRTPARSQIASPVAAKMSGVASRQSAPTVVARKLSMLAVCILTCADADRDAETP